MLTATSPSTCPQGIWCLLVYVSVVVISFHALDHLNSPSTKCIHSIPPRPAGLLACCPAETCSCEEVQGTLPVTYVPATGPTPTQATWETGFQSTVTTRRPPRVNKATTVQAAFQSMSSCPPSTTWDAQRDSWQRQWTEMHLGCVYGRGRSRGLCSISGPAAAFTLCGLPQECRALP